MLFEIPLLPQLSGRRTFRRGVHPPEGKHWSAEKPVEVLPAPKSILLPLHQHTGAPATPVVKPRTELAVGTLVGRIPEGKLSANVHSSVAGKAQAVTAVTLPNGRRSLAVPVAVAGETEEDLWGELFGGEWPLEVPPEWTPDQIVETVREAGIVGLGGAAFPTHVKLQPPPSKPISTVLLNGSECEPFLTADYRLMVEAPRAVVAGLRLAMRAVQAERGVVAIEDNKPRAVEAVRAAAANLPDVEVVVCQTKYPMGGERQLIPAVFGKEVPTGGLPLDTGVLVMNVATAAAVAAAVYRNRPLTHRIVSVSGPGIHEPKNLLVPIGTPLSVLLEHCGGLKDEACRVIAGGPMMGFSVVDLNSPVTKATGGLTVLTREEVDRAEQTVCVRCGRCVDVCPLGLAPTKIAHAAKVGDLETAKRWDLLACMECGCCAYECPARIPLVQYIRAGKAAARRLAPTR